MLTCILDNSLCETGERQIIGLTDDTRSFRFMCGCFRRVFTVLIFLQPVAQGPNDRGDYADYHAYLDKLDRDRNNRQ
jgi:hypothetical protein